MASRPYLESQTYSATLGGTTYNVAVGFATETDFSGLYNVKSYGATGDGVTSDTSSIQAAIDACVAGGGGTVYFPSGTYIMGRVTIGGSINLLGEGAGEVPAGTYFGTVIKMPNAAVQGQEAEAAAASALFYFTIRAEQCYIKNMSIRAADYGHASTQVIHYAYGADRCVCENLQIVGWNNSGAYTRVGIRMDGEDPGATATLSYNNMIRDCFIYGLKYGIHFNGDSGVGKSLNNNTVENCTFDVMRTTSIRLDDGTDVKFLYNNFNGSTDMPTAYVELDGPWTSIVSVGNYFDNVGQGGNTSVAYSLTNFANGDIRCPISSIGDNQPPTAFSLNDGQVVYNGKFPTGSVMYGSGTPEGAIIAGVGTMFMRSDGGAGTTLYVKETGTGNTGWVGK